MKKKIKDLTQQDVDSICKKHFVDCCGDNCPLLNPALDFIDDCRHFEKDREKYLSVLEKEVDV